MEQLSNHEQTMGEMNDALGKETNKPIKSPKATVLIGVIVVLALCLAGAVTWGVLASQESAGQSGDGDCLKCAEIDEDQPIFPIASGDLAQQEADVMQIVSVVKDAADQYLKVDNKYDTGISYQHGLMYWNVYNGGIAPSYRPAGSMVPILMDRTYGFYANDLGYYANNSTTEQLVNKVSSADFNKLIDNTFAENGFYRYEDYEASAAYVNDENGVICILNYGLPLQLGCSHKLWYDADSDEIALANELAEAYAIGIGGIPSDTTVYVNVNLEHHPIKDSPVTPYQTVAANGAGALMLFYRSGPDQKWQYFMSTQAPLGCEDYNTEELRKAYAGEVCYEGEGAQESVVKPE